VADVFAIAGGLAKLTVKRSPRPLPLHPVLVLTTGLLLGIFFFVRARFVDVGHGSHPVAANGFAANKGFYGSLALASTIYVLPRRAAVVVKPFLARVLYPT